MDDIDQNLLRLLGQNARAPLSQLASKLGVSRGTVRNRIAKLENQKVINRFTVELTSKNIGNEIIAFALIKLHANDGRRTLIALRKIPGITAIHTLSGPHDLIAELNVETLPALDGVLDRIRNISDVAETQSHIKLVDVSGERRAVSGAAA